MPDGRGDGTDGPGVSGGSPAGGGGGDGGGGGGAGCAGGIGVAGEDVGDDFDRACASSENGGEPSKDIVLIRTTKIMGARVPQKRGKVVIFFFHDLISYS